MTHTITPETITERITDWRDRRSVNREQRIIGNVALAGRESRNGYAYTPESLQAAVPLYENKPVFLDHPRDRQHSRDRSTRDLAGSVINARFEDGRVRGDIRVLDTDSGRTLLALVEDEAPGVGMSHVVLAERSPDGKRVERIHDVISVDVVFNPATTRTFQESLGTATPRPASTPLTDELIPLRSEISQLRSERQQLEERFKLITAQLGELQLGLHIQHLIDTMKIPGDAVTAELREQLRHLPDDQSRRRLLSSRSQHLGSQRAAVRSFERGPINHTASADDQFLAAFRRK